MKNKDLFIRYLQEVNTIEDQDDIKANNDFIIKDKFENFLYWTLTLSAVTYTLFHVLLEIAYRFKTAIAWQNF